MYNRHNYSHLCWGYEIMPYNLSQISSKVLWVVVFMLVRGGGGEEGREGLMFFSAKELELTCLEVPELTVSKSVSGRLGYRLSFHRVALLLFLWFWIKYLDFPWVWSSERNLILSQFASVREIFFTDLLTAFHFLHWVLAKYIHAYFQS